MLAIRRIAALATVVFFAGASAQAEEPSIQLINAAMLPTSSAPQEPTGPTPFNMFAGACANAGGQATTHPAVSGGQALVCSGSRHGSVVLTSNLDTASGTWKYTAIYERDWTGPAKTMARQLGMLKALMPGLQVNASPGVMTIEHRVGRVPSCTPLASGGWKCCYR